MNELRLNLPIYIKMGKNVRFSLNLNAYRNAHFHVLNKAKTLFEGIVAKRINHLPKMTGVELTYSLFFGSKRAIDISNICCIVDKFFCDTLVNQKKLIDDNMGIISKVTYQFGGVDKVDPRIEVTLSNIQQVEEPMQIILTQQEVEDAIRDTVMQQITVREDQGISITFVQAKDTGFSAVVAIQKIADETTPKKVRTRRANQVEESQPEPAKAHVTTDELATMLQPSLSQPIDAPKMPDFTQSGGGGTMPLPTVPKIFPDINSSAPVQQAPVAGPTSASPKSLFANLTKPVHDPAQE